MMTVGRLDRLVLRLVHSDAVSIFLLLLLHLFYSISLPFEAVYLVVLLPV